MRSTISDIVNQDVDFKRLRFITVGTTASIIAERKRFGEIYFETIPFKIPIKRLEKLAQDILNALDKKAQYEGWHPTLGELEHRLEETNQFQELDLWFIDMIRRAVSLEQRERIKQVQLIYEWLKSNEDWLYGREKI